MDCNVLRPCSRANSHDCKTGKRRATSRGEKVANRPEMFSYRTSRAACIPSKYVGSSLLCFMPGCDGMDLWVQMTLLVLRFVLAEALVQLFELVGLKLVHSSLQWVRAMERCSNRRLWVCILLMVKKAKSTRSRGWEFRMPNTMRNRQWGVEHETEPVTNREGRHMPGFFNRYQGFTEEIRYEAALRILSEAKLASLWVKSRANIFNAPDGDIAYMKICLMWESLPLALGDLALSLAKDIPQ